MPYFAMGIAYNGSLRLCWRNCDVFCDDKDDSLQWLCQSCRGLDMAKSPIVWGEIEGTTAIKTSLNCAYAQ